MISIFYGLKQNARNTWTSRIAKEIRIMYLLSQLRAEMNLFIRLAKKVRNASVDPTICLIGVLMHISLSSQYFSKAYILVWGSHLFLMYSSVHLAYL